MEKKVLKNVLGSKARRRKNVSRFLAVERNAKICRLGRHGIMAHAVRQMVGKAATDVVERVDVESTGRHGVQVVLVDVVVGVDASRCRPDAARVPCRRFEDDQIKSIVHFVLIRRAVHDLGDDDEAERGRNEAEADYSGRRREDVGVPVALVLNRHVGSLVLVGRQLQGRQSGLHARHKVQIGVEQYYQSENNFFVDV